MKMPQLYPGQDAGMTCYYDENTFVKFGVFADTGAAAASDCESSRSHWRTGERKRQH